MFAARMQCASRPGVPALPRRRRAFGANPTAAAWRGCVNNAGSFGFDARPAQITLQTISVQISDLTDQVSGQFSDLTEQVSHLSDRVKAVKENIEQLKDDTQQLKDDTQQLKDDTKQIKEWLDPSRKPVLSKMWEVMKGLMMIGGFIALCIMSYLMWRTTA